LISIECHNGKKITLSSERFFSLNIDRCSYSAELKSNGKTYTPVLKFRMNTTDVDLLFAPLDLEKLPEPLDIMDDSLMNGLDDVSVRSLNGARVAEYLLDLVPDQSVFRVALRAIKKWARCKGLYSNVLGLLGGINCAILVAFVCQKYPLKDPAVVVEKFFRVMEAWDWPNPIMLRQPSADDARAWNPRLNPRDRAHLAPIVTPAHPSMNSSYNIGAPQLRAIKEELTLGKSETRRIQKLAHSETRTPKQLQRAWRRFFRPSDFFEAHRHYVQVDVSADSDDALRRWTAWCESRLRQFVVALDLETPARVHATPLENTNGARKTRSFFVGLVFRTDSSGVRFKVDLTPQVREFSARVNCWTLRTEGMDLCLRHTSRDDLPLEVRTVYDSSSEEEEEAAIANLTPERYADVCVYEFAIPEFQRYGMRGDAYELIDQGWAKFTPCKGSASFSIFLEHMSGNPKFGIL